MKKYIRYHLVGIIAALLFVGCDVKEPIYNTSHPDSGTITLTVDWSNISEGYSIPENYTVQIGDYTTTLSGTTNTLDHLFAPGTYDVLVYHNSSKAIEVVGTTVTIKQDIPLEGNFFACWMQVEIAKDTDHTFTAVMKQQLRQLTLTVDWSKIGEGYSIPESYTVRIGDYATTLSGTTNTLSRLFAPDTYDVLVYHNSSKAVEVVGTTAIMKQDLPLEGNLFACYTQVEIAKDADYAFTAVMKQQLRQLTLLIKPTGENIDKIETIKERVVMADKLNLLNGTYADQTIYSADFSKITEGPDAGKWSATFPVLGVLPNQPTVLETTLSFNYNNLNPLVVTGDLTNALTGFNDDKSTPMTLGLTMPVNVNVSTIEYERVAQDIYPPLADIGAKPVLNTLLSPDGSEYQTFYLKRPENGTYALQTTLVTDVTSWEKKTDGIVFLNILPGMLPVIVNLDQMVRFNDMLLVSEFGGQYRLFLSANGGTDWSKLKINNEEKMSVRAILGEVGRTGYLTIIEGKADRYFYRTADLVTWERSGQPVPDDFPDVSFAKINTPDGLTLVGGSLTNGSNRTQLNTTWSTKDGLNWTKHDTAPFDVPREGASGALCNDIFYLIGGTDANNQTTEDIRYSTDRGHNWYKIVLPQETSQGYTARSYASVMVDKQNRILIFSGRKTSTSPWLDEVWRLAPKVTSEGKIILNN